MIGKISDPYSFLDDYSEGAHPRLLEALLRTNTSQQTGYGSDEYTREARQLLLSQLQATEQDVAIHFVPSGTAANLISIASCLRPFEAVLAVQTGHIIDKEAGAIEATGHRIIPVPGVRGKMTPENLEVVLDQNTFFPHMAKPRLVYISTATELGTIYSKRELTALSDTCRRRDLLLLVDGARLGVALAAEANDVTLRDLVDYTDIFWIGGTKMGALLGEAIVVQRVLAEGFEFHLKQRGALLGKSRVLGVQFSELFRGDGLFLELARHANAMARRIATAFVRRGWQLAEETETNQVFVVVEDEMLHQLEERIRFYPWERRAASTTATAYSSGMRLSISCDHCRQSKVKCVHDGHPPCRRCLRLDRSPCQLTDSRSPSTPSFSRRAARTARTAGTATTSTASTTSTTPTAPVAQPPGSVSPVLALPPSTLLAACDLYRKKFPVVNFLHYPSLIADLSRDVAVVEPVFLAALLSLCARFMTDAALAPSESYAQYARSQLAHRAFESPSLPLAQSLVMVSLYEWGSGRPYRAWMYSGMATYMIQSLLKSADDHMEHAPDGFHAQIAYEQLVRTYWCCFAQDCELSSGARQHFALSFRQISVPLPISDADFNFGRATRRLTPADIQGVVPGGVRLGIEQGLTIVTRGFDIFVRILRFANESRRDRARGALPSSSSSSAWKSLKEELDEWRALQDITVRYPETRAHVHVALGYGELFAYINLVYFMSVLFLYRDRFLASPKAHDSADRPENDADERIDRLFSTAQHIGDILSSLDSCATPVITPYAGFSIFVAAHINMYGTVCPLHYPGGLERAEQEKKSNLEYLERLCGFWDVGTSWWRTLQEANRFYENARSTQQGPESDQDHLALAGTFDEYGDIRISRPDPSVSQQRMTAPTHNPAMRRNSIRGSSISVEAEHGGPYDLEAEMMQWPFLDETWSVGFATGYETTWPGLG
ncbi:PLP-dependent transferase [Aspergillus varians]